MTLAFLLLPLLLSLAPSTSASEPDNPLDVDFNHPLALQEATRVLAEEVKVATRAQPYVLIDLTANAIIMKARGIELHRIPISKWSAESRDGMTGSFRLDARPTVVRRKADLSVTIEQQEPISLADMPTHYQLAFHPSLTLDIIPPANHAPVRWVLLHMKVWWRWLWQSVRSLISPQRSQAEPYLLLTVSEDHAQSLAWSLVDGMPLVIRRPSE